MKRRSIVCCFFARRSLPPILHHWVHELPNLNKQFFFCRAFASCSHPIGQSVRSNPPPWILEPRLVSARSKWWPSCRRLFGKSAAHRSKTFPLQRPCRGSHLRPRYIHLAWMRYLCGEEKAFFAHKYCEYLPTNRQLNRKFCVKASTLTFCDHQNQKKKTEKKCTLLVGRLYNDSTKTLQSISSRLRNKGEFILRKQKKI